MRSFRLGSVLGFEIRIHPSWFLIFLLVLWSFAAEVLPQAAPGLPGAFYFVLGTAVALLLYASLLAHELSHSLVARAKGVPVEGITLFLLGGVAHTRSEARSPGDEFQIAGAGPLASLVLAALFWAAAWAAEQAGLGAVALVPFFVALLNMVLAIFNLIPGFPLDGGRLFRAAAWKLTGDMTRATRWASIGGRLFGWALIALGAWQTVAAGLLGGLWFVLIGWFIRGAALAAWRQQLASDRLGAVRARDAMAPLPPLPDAIVHAPGIVAASPDDSLLQVLDAMRTADAGRALVVERGLVIGSVTAEDIQAYAAGRG